MKNLLTTTLLLLGLLGQAAEPKPNTVLVLTKKNTVVLRGVISESSVATIELELMEMSGKLKSTDIIYLILDTPGGSVSDGMNLVDFIHGLPQQVKTLSLFAASMGFHIAQNLDERLVLPNSTVMSHRISISGMGGQIPGEFLSELSFIMRISVRMDEIAAKRLNMSVESYKQVIRDELWLKGEEAVKYKAADRVILARCDSTFQGTTESELGNFFGISVMGTMSNCPLITGILKVRLVTEGDQDKTEAKNMCDIYGSDKLSFVKKYISTGKLLFNGKNSK